MFDYKRAVDDQTLSLAPFCSHALCKDVHLFIHSDGRNEHWKLTVFLISTWGH